MLTFVFHVPGRQDKMCGCVSTGCENSWICGNFQLEALNLFLICFSKLKYYGNFNHITQIVHSNAHLNPLKGIFSDKLLIIVEILSFHFAEIFNSQEIWGLKVLDFSRVWGLEGPGKSWEWIKPFYGYNHIHRDWIKKFFDFSIV